jgi:hypothetical protein
MLEKKAALIALGAILIAGPAFAAPECMYEGTAYSHGSAVCQSGNQYRCDGGKWTGLAIACTEGLAIDASSCEFNGRSYSAGSAACQSGSQYRCNEGAWTSLAVACTGSGEIEASRAHPRRTCMYNGATVSTESTICKSGITFRCDDGEWQNVGSACR